MKNMLLYYTVKELSQRKKATFSVFIVIAVCTFVLFSFSMLSYSSYTAESASLHHAYICRLSRTEAGSISNFEYVKEVELYCTSEGLYTAYVKFYDGSPLMIETQCSRIIKDLGYSPGNAEVKQNHAPYGYVNEQYYKLTVSPYVLSNFSIMIIFYLLTGLSICMALKIKNSRSSKEYGYMRALGLKKYEITKIALLQSIIIYISAIITALAVSIPIHKLICTLTEIAYVGGYVGLVFSISWSEMVLIICLIASVIIIFQLIHIGIMMKDDVVNLINGGKTYTISFASKSSRQMEKQDKIKAYVRIYYMRRIRSVIGGIGKAAALFALPMFLLIMSISFNESRADNDQRDFVLSPTTGDKITDSVIQDVMKIDSVSNIETGMKRADGTYDLINIYCKEDMQELCLVNLENIANNYSLALSDLYHMKKTLIAQANIFAPYYLLQSILMFACGLLIVGADLRYELHTRREEFAVIRAVGYPASALRQLLKSYPRRGILGYGMAAAGMFGFMGFAFQIWPTELMLYPFIVVIGFGVLDFVVHDRICRKCIKQIEEEEISAVLAGE